MSSLAVAAPAAAQVAQDEGPSIIVTGRGLGSARADDLYDLRIIDRDRLANSPSNRLEDLLRDIPGFQQFRRSDSRSANPTSQGATLRALGGNASSRALLILDGVPQSDPFGGWISWPALDPRRLGSIRVTRGGGTGSAGPGALAGTIELASAAPDDMEGLRAQAAYGSRDGIDAFAGYGVPLGAGFVSLSGSWAQGDGFVPVVAEQRGPVDRASPYRQASFAARAVAPITANNELQANVLVFTDRRERGTAQSEIETKGADASLRLVGRGPLPFFLLAYVQIRDFSNQFAAVNADRSVVTPTLDQYSVPSTGLGARVEFRPKIGSADLRLGADARQTEGRTHELFQNVGGSFARQRVAGGRSRTIGGFAELDWARGPLTLSAGGRLDHWSIDDGALRERQIATGALVTDTLFPDRSGWEATGRAGIGLRVTNHLVLRAAAYRGWRLPTLNELYRPFRIGPDATAANAALVPERLDGAEVGVDWRPAEGLRIGATLFANRIEDAISNVTLGVGPGVFPGVGFVAAGGEFRQRRNVDAIVSRGLEIDLGFATGPWNLTAGYSLADAEIEASGLALPIDGLRPAQAPRHSASALLSWRSPGGAYAAFGAHYVGDQYEDDLNLQRLGDALTFDAIAILPIARTLSIVGRAENLTDARVVAAISGAGIIERATPRTLWIGIRWRD